LVHDFREQGHNGIFIGPAASQWAIRKSVQPANCTAALQDKTASLDRSGTPKIQESGQAQRMNAKQIAATDKVRGTDCLNFRLGRMDCGRRSRFE
jgi:hypothetical protein